MTDLSGTPRQPPPASWYRDRSDPSLLRYWDGTRWTEHTHPAPTRDAASAGIQVDDDGATETPSAAPRDQLAASYLASGSYSLFDRDGSSAASVNTSDASGVVSQQEATGSAVATATATATMHRVPVEEVDKPEGGQPVGISAELRELVSLRDEGVLTAEEFDAQKERLLADGADLVAGTIEQEAEKSRRMAFVVILLIIGALVIWGATSAQENSRQDGRDRACEYIQESVDPLSDC